MTNSDDSGDAPSQNGRVIPASSSTDSDAVEICAGCHLPLTRRGPKGECFRCLMDFAFSPDGEESPLNDSSVAEQSRKSALRYGHFEIATGADGHPVELGSGAMATTYRALDSVLHSVVALKVINQKVAEHPAARARFLREARAAAKLHHLNVASVSHYGEQDGECYYVMELVEGETLEARVRREGPLSPALVLEVGIQVARALAAAEACGVMHRDLKPSNLMLTAHQGEAAGSASTIVKVIDWGLAKAVTAESALGADHTQGAFVGTPSFASPEQFSRAQDRRVDTRSDIYSLGVTLWYLLCGRPPFVGSTLDEIHTRQVQQALPLAQLTTARVPECMVDLLKSMLAVDPASRPQSARELIEALRCCQEQHPFGQVPRPASRREFRRVAALFALLLAFAGCVVGGWRYFLRASSSPPDRSIAVLPFENLSPDKADAFFTVGVQDEITADLARVASLKVIGSDSTRYYTAGNRDLAKICRELGVWHLLEGSVRREGGQVHVAVRLVDVRSPGHPWTNQYDRRLSDVFAVQGEITRAVADRLDVALSESQKVAIDEPPTSDLAAYDLYLRAREVPRAMTRSDGTDIFANAQRAIQWLDEAIAHDPKFSLAYCELARRHDELYFYRSICPPEELLVDHRGLAEMALAKATRLRPDSGALHLSLAIHALQVNHDPEQAEIEIELARRSLPNNAQAEAMAGRVARRQDHWDEAVRCLQRAVALEPRDTELCSILANTYHYLRRYDELDRTMASIIALTPSGEMGTLQFERALFQAERKADLAAAQEELPSMVAAKQDNNIRKSFEMVVALWTRDDRELARLLSDKGWTSIHDTGVSYPKEWYEALGARMRGDQNAAAKAFTAARAEIEKTILSESYYGRPLSVLAIIDAGLGRKDQAIEEAKRACELTPFSTMNLDAPVVRCNLAVVYAWTGQNNLALTELDKLIDRPAGNNSVFQPTYGDLRLNPLWDPLRSDPRFEALAKRLAPSPRAEATVKK